MSKSLWFPSKSRTLWSKSVTFRSKSETFWSKSRIFWSEYQQFRSKYQTFRSILRASLFYGANSAILKQHYFIYDCNIIYYSYIMISEFSRKLFWSLCRFTCLDWRIFFPFITVLYLFCGNNVVLCSCRATLNYIIYCIHQEKTLAFAKCSKMKLKKD